jgi:AraC family transcriptional regulator
VVQARSSLRSDSIETKRKNGQALRRRRALRIERMSHDEPQRAPYEARFRAVLRYIDANLDEDLSVDRLSAVASSSKFHFHWQFSALFGVPAARYVTLARMYRASCRLAFRREQSVLQIALEHGYESHEAFARSFKKSTGQSPSSFRATPDWQRRADTFAQLHTVKREHMHKPPSASDVVVRHVSSTPVALLVHRGAPARVGDSVRTFIAFRKANGLPPSRSATFNIVYDDPSQTRPEEYRFGLAAEIIAPLGPNEHGVTESEIPAGRVATLRHVGDDASLFRAVAYLYSEWLPASGEKTRDFPLYLQRVRFAPSVAEHEAESEIFLPLR